jgi:YgiT-type zinc finger domain-containing protein
MIYMSKCPLCGADLQDGTSTFTVDQVDVLVVARNVPAKVCRQCGEAWIGDEMAEKLEQIVRDAKSQRRQLEVIDMAA